MLEISSISLVNSNVVIGQKFGYKTKIIEFLYYFMLKLVLLSYHNYKFIKENYFNSALNCSTNLIALQSKLCDIKYESTFRNHS